MMRTHRSRPRPLRRRRLAAALCLGVLVPLGGCYLTLTETGPKVVCERSDYRYVQEPFGGYYVTIDPIVGAFCPGYAVP